MKKRGILILYAVICAVLSAAAILTLLLTRNTTSDAVDTDIAVTTFESIPTEIVIEREGETVTLTTSGDVWVLNGDHEIPANQSKADTLASALSHMQAVRELEPAASETDYGLDAGIRVTARNAAGEAAALQIGSLTPGLDARYVLSDDRLYTVEAGIAGLFDSGLLDLLEYDRMPDVLASELVSLLIQRDSFELELLYDEEGQYPAYEHIFDWFIGRPFDTPQAADTRQAHALFYDVTGMYIYGCAAWRPADDAAYGLDKPLCRATVVYRNTDGVTQSTAAISFGSENADGFIYARFDGSDQVLLVNASIVRQIAYTVPSDLLPRQICGILLDTVTKLTVTTADGTHVFEGKTLADDGFIHTYEEMTAITEADRAPDTSPSEAPVLTVEFERDTDHDAQMTLFYYPYDARYYLAVFNGRKNQLVERQAVDEVLAEFAELSES